MRHIDEYRDSAVAKNLVLKIAELAKSDLKLMEVCGTHTVSIFRSGIRSLLPENVALLSGPGCPVCVTSMQEIDKFIKLCRQPDIIITTFGDLIRVPGSSSSLQKERANGADIRIVYSSFEALEIARRNPSRPVAFLGVGFETTAPTIAAALKEADQASISNFCVISAHKLVPPALLALLAGGDLAVDGFICPGHVSVMIGGAAYQPVVDQYKIPCVIAGFEPVDILQSIYMLLTQIRNSETRVEIQYSRAVDLKGNQKAMSLMFEVFESCDSHWRGLGLIPQSGLRLRERYRHLDAESRFDLDIPNEPSGSACRCGEILRGIKNPTECPLFRKVCTPSNPIGPCMVSSEGTCAAYYKYHG